MTDDPFRLTPLDVRRYDFGSALRGYDKTRVDQFRDQVADELERVSRQVVDLETRANGFLEQLRAFRERDKALNEALVSAQQLRAEIREQAERESSLILREARAEAERIIDAARHQVQSLRSEAEYLEKQRRTHLLQLRAMTERQLAEVEAMLATAPGEAVTPTADAPPARASVPSAAAMPAPTPSSWLDAPAGDSGEDAEA
ncbi:MAG: DivIVA domain-containing protein [Gemmatimonadaceae bacterium]|nr:DivIVA domain-containing protein [Gemmatimonadaceae bacterium]